MTRFWLVRHGPTHQKTFTGWRDVPADLSDTDALNRLSDYLPMDALLTSSDLQRSVKTADAIAGPRTRLAARKSLREFDFGVWDGMHHSEVAARDPILSRAFWENPGDLAAPHGESWNAVTRRVTDALTNIAQENMNANIVVVGHMGMIMTMIAQCGYTPYAAMGHKIDNLSVTDMRLTLQGWQIGTINHLA
ncbi:broad specificity phosphatase PhoE [Loktanella ponticola]|uniref:Broad specificity phosphatase PhoE n=1 Tax=Yoonia ponticola TaxID=1524255 RepID=A0A7W9EXW2_9RHOB|nr:histidine phosphatase family protein [Yoonia ponticola]MBB5720490.1 broad specificity phosphatase PhoE [Yoonia ponticola]